LLASVMSARRGSERLDLKRRRFVFPVAFNPLLKTLYYARLERVNGLAARRIENSNMTTHVHLPLASPLLLLLAGCSSYGVTTTEVPAVAPFGAAAAGEARVCVVRGGAPAPLYTTVVYDNAKLVGATVDGTYFCYGAEPGDHVIVSDGTFGRRTARLIAVPGGHYYLKQAWLLPAVRGHALSWIDEPSARDEMDGDAYAVLSEVPASEALPGARPVAPAAR
jgi:hypothetical protein